MPDRPNILVLLTDQLRPFELSCHGHPVVKTPNIDRLAAGGVRFEYACTSNPVCTPARSSVISGQYSRTCTGMLGCVGDPASRRCHFPDTTLAERLQTAGYDAALVGKWHIGPSPRIVGFAETVYPKVHHLNQNQLYFDGTGHSWVQEGFCPDFEVQTTQQFLRRRRERPFFLFHNLCLPHMPYFDVPDRYRRRYRPEDVLLRPNTTIGGKLYYDENAFLIYYYDHLYYREHRPDMQTLPDGYDLHALTAHYCGMIASVDEQVGQILDTLADAGLAENTIVLFTSDHGDNLGSQHLWNKISVNDEAIRIPFIVSWPGTLQPRVAREHVASLVDVAPTLLSLAVGANHRVRPQPVPPFMQGRDLSPILRGDAARIGIGEAIIENLRGELAIRTPSHLYAVMTETQHGTPLRKLTDDRFMFYDTRIDPYEMTNLAKTGEQQDVARDLRERILTWDRETPWMPGTLGGTYGQGPER